MTTFPGSPKLVKGGIVLLDPVTSAVQRIIALQYNPETLTHTLQVQGVGGEGGDRSEALRIKGPPVDHSMCDWRKPGVAFEQPIDGIRINKFYIILR